jgi:hypothetical protein
MMVGGDARVWPVGVGWVLIFASSSLAATPIDCNATGI